MSFSKLWMVGLVSIGGCSLRWRCKFRPDAPSTVSALSSLNEQYTYHGFTKELTLRLNFARILYCFGFPWNLNLLIVTDGPTVRQRTILDYYTWRTTPSHECCANYCPCIVFRIFSWIWYCRCYISSSNPFFLL